MDDSSNLETSILGLSRADKVGDFILLIDGSLSIKPDHWDIIRFSCRHLLSRIYLKKSRAAIVQFSKYARIEHEFSQDLYSLQLTINNLRQMGENTNANIALELCGDMFAANTTNAEPIIILLTDGDASDAPENKALELRTKQKVHIIGIGIGKDVSRVKLEQVASLNNCFMIPSMEALRAIFTKIGTHAFEKPNVKTLRRFCDKLEVEIGCSEMIAEFKVELFDTTADTADKYKLVNSIVVPNPNEALVKAFITDLKHNSCVDFRVYGVLKNNGKHTDYVYMKDNTLNEKKDSGTLKDPVLLKEQIDKLLNDLKKWRPNQFLTEHLGMLDATVALLGRVGEGKSSFINTVLSVFSGYYHQIAVAMAHTKTVTSQLTLYPLTGTHIHLMDSYGWEDNNYSQDEQKLICDGILSHGFKEGESQASYLLRRNTPQKAASFKSSVHGVILICDADAVTNKTFMLRLKQFELTWKTFQRSLIIILTKCDNADPELVLHPESIYDSEIVEKRISTLSALTGIDKGDIYPCVNRTGLNNSNPAVREYLALKALHSCIFSAVTGVLEAERSKLAVDLLQSQQDSPEPLRDLAEGHSTPSTPIKGQSMSPETNNSPYVPPKNQNGDPVVDDEPNSPPLQPSPPPKPAVPEHAKELILRIPLHDGTFVELALVERTLKGLKEAIVAIEEFGLADINAIGQLSKIVVEDNGAKSEIILRLDAEVNRLKENQTICFKPK